MNESLRPRVSGAVYAALALLWLAVAAWLAIEHSRVRSLAQEALLNRARDISNTVAVLTRTGGRPAIVRQDRLESALSELTESRELDSVALLNRVGEVVVTAGEPLRLNVEDLPEQGVRWQGSQVMVVNLVDFGVPAAAGEPTSRPATIIMPGWDETQRRPPPEFLPRGDRDGDTSPSAERPRPPWEGRERMRGFRGGEEENETSSASWGSGPGPREGWTRDPRPRDGENPTTGGFGEGRQGRFGPGGDDGPSPFRFRMFGRPPWMDAAQYEELLSRRGLHGFVLVLSTEAMRAELSRDLWLRLMIATVALVAVIGMAAAWRGMSRSTQLQLRLLRARELNEHLREMNLAAAGLAHETRNPLNIVRGLAQLIEQNALPAREVSGRARQIVEEVDRVNHRMNEFIDYSRPAEPRLAPTSLQSVARDVASALATDLEDKRITLAVDGGGLVVQADESLLRQVIFNLLLNAAQAVPEGGWIGISMLIDRAGEGMLRVEDDGPGVPEALREEVFRPYFTTREEGSGLGLALVRQIVLAHQWEIHYAPSARGGAAFIIRGMKILQERPTQEHDRQTLTDARPAETADR